MIKGSGRIGDGRGNRVPYERHRPCLEAAWSWVHMMTAHKECTMLEYSGDTQPIDDPSASTDTSNNLTDEERNDPLRAAA